MARSTFKGRSRVRKEGTRWGVCQCFGAFVCTLLVSLPMTLHMGKKMQTRAMNEQQTTALSGLTREKASLRTIPPTFSKVVNSPGTTTSSPLPSPHLPPFQQALASLLPLEKKSEDRHAKIKAKKTASGKAVGFKNGRALREALQAPRTDGVNATAVGHSWGLLPCAADQACARVPSFSGPVPLAGANPTVGEASLVKTPPASWLKAALKRSAEVSEFVLDMSLDVLSAGGTGEARLRARRHSAYGEHAAASATNAATNAAMGGGNVGGGAAGGTGDGRCGALFKPSTTEQLKTILSDAERKRATSSRARSEAKKAAEASKRKGRGRSAEGSALWNASSSALPSEEEAGVDYASGLTKKWVSFTITDATYGDMLNDVWAEVHRLGQDLQESFFFVALDKPTAFASCHHHMPTLFFSEPLTLPSDSKLFLPPRGKKFTSTKDRVYEAKYGLALALAREKTDFLFFEMDCWMLQHPLRAVQSHAVSADMYISLHQDNPFEFNVGYYFVRASSEASSDRVERFFTATLAYLRTHGDSFDQKLINCLMKSYSGLMALPDYRSLGGRAGCKGQKISLTDPSLTALTSQPKQVMTWALLEIDDVLSSATPLLGRDTSTLHVLTNVPLTAASGKKVVAKEVMVWEGAYCYYCVGTVEVAHLSHVGIHGPKGLVDGGEEEVDRLSASAQHVDDELEERTQGTAAADTAAAAPRGQKKKKAKREAAKEETPQRRRYLAFDGPLVAADLHTQGWPSSPQGGAKGAVNLVESLAASLLHLVAMAVYTDRILVLPVLSHDGRFVRAWEMLDLISAEQFVEWRETSFLRNPRLLVSEDATAARVNVGHSSASFELWRWGSGGDGGSGPLSPPTSYAYPTVPGATGEGNGRGGSEGSGSKKSGGLGGGLGGKSSLTARDGLWSVLRNTPEAVAADLLLVSFDRSFAQPEVACFRSSLSPCEFLLRNPIHPPLLNPLLSRGSLTTSGQGASQVAVVRSPVVAPPWLLVLAASMRWCGLDKVKIPQMAGMKALDDCFASSERQKSRNEGGVSAALYSAASDRCAVAHLQRTVEGHGDMDEMPEANPTKAKAQTAVRAGVRKQLAAPYALAVAHLLRQKGDSRKLGAALKKMEPPKLAQFADSFLKIMKKRQGKSNSDAC